VTLVPIEVIDAIFQPAGQASILEMTGKQ